MTETNIRIITSIFLLSTLIVSLNNNFFLTIFVILIFYQIIFEFQNMIKKIYKNKKFVTFIILLLIIFYMFSISLIVWQIIFFDSEFYKKKLLLIFLVCILTDTGGYIFGKTLKGKKLTKISPGKTYSGMYGSYILSLALTPMIFKNHISIEIILISTFIISSVSQFGDLFISYLKRKSNIKDTDNILPGHGGLLDRFDGFIFAIPVGLILFKIL